MLKIREPSLHENALKVLKKQLYLWPRADGTQETPGEMFARVAEFVASAEKKWGASDTVVGNWAITFRDIMVDKDFIPNSPCLQNAGREKGQLAACFVLPIDDSIESIYQTLQHTAQIQASGGGTGFSGARLRSKGSPVGKWGKKSDGNIPFIELYNFSSKKVLLQGSARKGANMYVIPVWHADVEEFINLKKDPDSSITQFNISVGATDEFMKAVENDTDWDLIDPHAGVVKTVRARELFDRIVENAWITGDPGLIFLDRANEDNPTPSIGLYEATNPCGEQPLLPYEACVLGHLNLGQYVTSDGQVDYEKLDRVARIAVRFLDNVIDVNHFPIPQIAAMHRDGNRKIGVGVMGWADMLTKLGIPYDSEEARELGDKIAFMIRGACNEMSVALAQERGSFPNFEKSVLKDRYPKGIRNACVMTVAPTGTTGVIFGASTAIEPLFGLIITRQQAGMVMDEVHPAFERWLHSTYQADEFKIKQIIEYVKEHGSIIGCPQVAARHQKLWQQANDVSTQGHILMQAAWQRHIDSAVSKTINLPHSATIDDVRGAYLLAYTTRCKGITIYRDGSKTGQALSVQKADPKVTKQPEPVVTMDAFRLASMIKQQPKATVQEALKLLDIKVAEPDVKTINVSRDRVTQGGARKIPTGCGNAFIFIGNGKDGQIDDVVGKLGKGGGCAAAWWEALTRITSLAIRSGVDSNELRKQLTGISCHLPAMYTDSPLKSPGGKPHMITSCADALATALLEHQNEYAQRDQSQTEPVTVYSNKPEHDDKRHHMGACPDCGSSSLEYGGGCRTCISCGFSACS